MNALNDFLRGKAHLYHSGEVNRNPRACHVPSKEHTTQSVDLVVAVLFPRQHKTRVLPSLRYPTILCGQNNTPRSTPGPAPCSAPQGHTKSESEGGVASIFLFSHDSAFYLACSRNGPDRPGACCPQPLGSLSTSAVNRAEDTDSLWSCRNSRL
jgi:hypothetical protein